MAVLSRKTSDGTPGFTKYVVNNPRLNDTWFRIENGKTSELLVVGTKNSYEPKKNVLLNSSSKFKVKPELIKINGTDFAKINYQNTDGFIPLNKIRKPTADINLQERDLVEKLNALIAASGGNLTVRLGTMVFKNINYASRVERSALGSRYSKDPKADIILHVKKDKLVSDTSIYISYKAGNSAKDFRQYGGLSLSALGDINQHKEVQKFLGQIGSMITDKGLISPTKKSISDNDLKSKAVFGPERQGQSRNFSPQNVHVVAQGRPTLSLNDAYDNDYDLKFEEMFFKVTDLTSGYTPILGAIPTSETSRGFTHEGKRYGRTRVGIYPKDYFNRPRVKDLDTMRDGETDA